MGFTLDFNQKNRPKDLIQARGIEIQTRQIQISLSHLDKIIPKSQIRTT